MAEKLTSSCKCPYPSWLKQDRVYLCFLVLGFSFVATVSSMVSSGMSSEQLNRETACRNHGSQLTASTVPSVLGQNPGTELSQTGRGNGDIEMHSMSSGAVFTVATQGNPNVNIIGPLRAL